MFKKNLAFINNDELKKRLEVLTIDDAAKGISYCVTPSNDYILLKDDVPIDDLNNPRTAVKELLGSTIKNPMSANDIIINFGIGLGYLLDETYNNYSSKIFIYEPDIKLLYFVLNNVDISEHLSSGRVYITDKIDELERKLGETYITKDKVEIVYLKNYAIIKNKELLDLTQKVYETCKSKMIDVNTITKYSKIWLQNTLKNIDSINNSNVYKLSDLEGKFVGKTALIVAAGPSLAENIEKIKENRNKFIIFAVNKAFRILAVNDITPDFVVCLDAEHITPTLTGLEEFCKKSCCIMDLKSDTAILGKNFKKIFVSFSQNDFIIKSLANYNSGIKIYECGGSATTLALVAAIKIGFSKIIFSGLDLALKGDTLYSTGEKIRKVDNNKIAIGKVTKNLVEIKSVTGETVITRDDYAAFIKHFELLIQEMNYHEIYNTTSFGAYIEGMKNVSFNSLQIPFPAGSLAFLTDGIDPFKFDIKDWAQQELFLINNIITLLSKGTFSPALISAIVKSPLMYQYMQADILRVLQSKLDTNLAEEFISQAKIGIKEVVDLLQKNRLI